MKWMMMAGLLLGGSGVALAHDSDWRADRVEQRREEARQELQRKLDDCNGRRRCQRDAYRDYHRDMARIDRHRF